MHRWTDEQVSYLKETVKRNDISYTQIACMINKEFDLQLSVAQIMRELEVAKIDHTEHRKYQRANIEYVDFLKENSKDHTCTELTNMLNDKFGTNYKVECIRRILDNFNLEYQKRDITTRQYTTEQLDFIRERKDNTYQKIVDEFYTEFGVKLSRGSINYVINRYGIERESKRMEWTDEKINFIKEHFKNMTNLEIAECFNKEFNENITALQVNEKLHREGLKAQKRRKDSVGECIQTSFMVSYKLHELCKNTAKEVGISNSKFMRDSLEWFLNNDLEISPYISSYLHTLPYTKKKNYLQTVKTPMELQNKIVAYANKHNCQIGDIYLQSIIDYCNHVNNDVKYLVEDLF